MASETVQDPRLIVMGDVIVPKGRQKPEVVRGVSFVVHMADGTDVVYEDDDEVRLAPDDVSETVSMQEIKEAKRRELENADAAIEREKKHLEDLTKRMKELEDLQEQRKVKEQAISEMQDADEGE